MTTDHIAEAVRLTKEGEAHLRQPSNLTNYAVAYARLAQVHATLSLSDPSPELDHVRAAGRELLAALADETDHDPASSRRVDDARDALWPLVREVTS
jgi:hypothetical protein